MAIEHLKNKVTTFLQIKKINEIVDGLEKYDSLINTNTIQGLLNQYNDRLENMKNFLNNNVLDNINNLKDFINTTLSGYYTKTESDNRFIKLNEILDFIRYQDPRTNEKLIINSGNNPCITFTQESSNVLFNIDEYSISAFPFKLSRGNKNIFEVNSTGLVTNKTIITTNNYRKFVKLTSWKNQQEMNLYLKNSWKEAYAYNISSWEYRPVFFLIKDASVRGYNPWNDPNDGPATNMSVSFFNYNEYDKNHYIITRLELDPYDSKFKVNAIYRQRRKHRSSYNHNWKGITDNYVIKWR